MIFGDTRLPAALKAHSQLLQAQSADGSRVTSLVGAAALAVGAAGYEFDEKSARVPEIFTLKLKAMP